jgi:hypothetical protein
MAVFLNDLVLLMAFTRHPRIRKLLKFVGLLVLGIPAVAVSLVAVGTMILGMFSIAGAVLSDGNASSLFVNVVGWISLTVFASWILLFSASKKANDSLG